MPALDERTIIFFIAGIEPTAEEAALIARIRGTVLVRSADTSFSPLYGTHLETADGLAGSIPDSYKTGEGTTIDTALYPSGDVTPTTTAVPEDFDVFPATMALKVGETKDIPAISGDLNETTGAITLTNKAAAATVEWASSDETKATVDTNGIVTGVAAGTTNITATYTPAEGETPIVSTCAVTVSAATAVTELVLPSTAAVVVGLTTNLKAGEAKSDGTLTDATTSGAWSSSDEAVATVGAATGVVTGIGAGSATITFTKGGLTSTCVVTVSAAASDLEIVLPSTASVVVGTTVNLFAAEKKTDGTLTDVTTTAVWSSGTEANATVGAATGVVTGVQAGESIITATKGTKTSTCTVTVVAATSDLEIVLPTAISVVVGKTAQLSAAELLTDGTLTDVTTTGAWSSGTEANATVGAATGIVTGVQAGESIVTFTKGTKTATCTVTVVAVTTDKVKVLPATLEIAGLATFQLECAEALTDDTLQSATATAGAWVSSDPTKASINADTGVVTGAAAGETTITFTKNTKTSTCVVTCTG